MRQAHPRMFVSLVLFIAALVGVAVWISCGGNSTPNANNAGTVTTTISDPPSCTPPNGNYQALWVTITKVTAHINADAGPNDSGWQTLVDLTKAPMQVELFSLAQTTLTCVLKTLGSTTGLPPGNYQQIRLYLMDNSTTPGPASNACSGVSANNCVKVNGNIVPLLLSSEAQTGIKIPSGQINGGGINLQANQSADINISFMSCESLVMEGNGNVRLKPVLHADEVALNTNTLAGHVVDSVSGAGVPNAMVLLEQVPSGGNMEQVMESGVTDSSGNFFFCPLPQGAKFDVVIGASSWDGTTGTTYNSTVTLQVPVGSNLGDVKLVAETAPSSPAIITGQITTTSAASSPGSSDHTAAIVTLTPLQSTGGGSPVIFISPFFAGSTPSVTTVAGTTAAPCPTGTDCVNYTLNVPGSNPQVGTWSSSGTTYVAPAANPAIFWVWAQAFNPTTPTDTDCTPSSLPATFDSSTQLSLAPGANPAHNISFVSCTAGL